MSDEFGFWLVGFYEDIESFWNEVEIEKIGFYLFVIWNIFEDINVIYEFEYMS